MKILKKLLIVATLFYAPLYTMAWGTQGHRICGQIAESYLTPKARAAVKAILGHESVAMASTWADFIKSDSTYKYLDSWHYIDLEPMKSYAEAAAFMKRDTSTDAYTKLNFLIGELKKKTLPLEKKRFYLRMLIHIAEDVHQPMHAVGQEQGGNGIKLNYAGQPTNLHSVWDSRLIDNQQLSYTEYTNWINFTTPAERATLQKQPISQWIYESNQLGNRIIADTKPNDNLSYRYNFKYIATVNRQLLKAGVHLAGLLNQIFG